MASSELATIGGVSVLRWPALAHAGVTAMVTTRDGGVSSGPYASLNLGLHVGDDAASVIENRRRAAQCMGADLEDLVFANQVHGTDVVSISASDRGRGVLRADDAVADADVLLTTSREPVLVVLVADCVPIVLFDPTTRVLCCVHAGWRGTVARAATRAVSAMSALGARPESILAGIGPAVAPSNYVVGEDVRSAARHAGFDELGPVFAQAPGEGCYFDLVEANGLLLVAAGLRAPNIHRSDASTGGLFFSDRAERPCGRFGLLARLGG